MSKPTLWLSEEQARTIGRHALDDAPREACGLIGGWAGQALRVVPIPNAADDPLHHYTLDPREMGRALLALHRDGLELVAFYHSHPRGEPIPSSEDIALATYPDTPFLIVGLRGDDPVLAAWHIADGEAEHCPLHIGLTAPESADAPLSRAQKTAIIISAVLGLVAMLAISLSLLPPAPPIP